MEKWQGDPTRRAGGAWTAQTRSAPHLLLPKCACVLEGGLTCCGRKLRALRLSFTTRSEPQKSIRWIAARQTARGRQAVLQAACGCAGALTPPCARARARAQNTNIAQAMALFATMLGLLLFSRAVFAFPILAIHNRLSKEPLTLREVVVAWRAPPRLRPPARPPARAPLLPRPPQGLPRSSSSPGASPARSTAPPCRTPLPPRSPRGPLTGRRRTGTAPQPAPTA